MLITILVMTETKISKFNFCFSFADNWNYDFELKIIYKDEYESYYETY